MNLVVRPWKFWTFGGMVLVTSLLAGIGISVYISHDESLIIKPYFAIFLSIFMFFLGLVVILLGQTTRMIIDKDTRTLILTKSNIFKNSKFGIKINQIKSVKIVMKSQEETSFYYLLRIQLTTGKEHEFFRIETVKKIKQLHSYLKKCLDKIESSSSQEDRFLNTSINIDNK